MRALVYILIVIAVPCQAKKVKNIGAADGFSSDLMNLNYYPHVGQIEFSPRITTEFHDSSSSSKGQTTTVARNNVVLEVAYGGFSRVEFSLLENLLWDQNLDTHTAGGAQTEATSHGFSNPVLGASWRFLEDGRNGLSGQLGVNASPSFGPKVTGNGAVNHDGNGLSGNSSLGALLAFFWRANFNETEILGSFNRNSTGRTEGDTSANSFDTNVNSNSTLTLNDRIHLSASLFAEVGGTGYMPTQVDLVTDAGVTRSSKQAFFINPHLLLGFRPDPGLVMILNLLYHHATTDVKVSRTGADVTTENTAVIAAIGILHQF